MGLIQICVIWVPFLIPIFDFSFSFLCFFPIASIAFLFYLHFVRGGKYSEEDAKVVTVQILSIVSFCHLQGVVHRDLKPEVYSTMGNFTI